MTNATRTVARRLGTGVLAVAAALALDSCAGVGSGAPSTATDAAARPTATGTVCTVADLARLAATSASAASCAHFTATTITAKSGVASADTRTPTTFWFERLNGALNLVANGPVNTLQVPITISGDTLVPDPEREAETAVGCDGSSVGCSTDGFLATFFGEPMNVAISGSRITLQGATGSIVAAANATTD